MCFGPDIMECAHAVRPLRSSCMPVAHPKVTLVNSWKDIVNFHKGFDCDMEPLQVKYCTSGHPGDPLEDFSLGYIDGMARACILHCVVLMVYDEVAACWVAYCIAV